MSRSEVDEYLAAVPEPGRATLEQLRRDLETLLPEAEEGIAYGSPAFKLSGRAVAGFAAFDDHLTYLPHSGSVLAGLIADVEDYVHSKGALRFALDTALPRPLVEKLVAARLAELGIGG